MVSRFWRDRHPGARTRRRLPALAISLATLAAAGTLRGQQPTPPPPVPEPPSPELQQFLKPNDVVLSEVRFDPTSGTPPFIELLNAGKDPADLRPMVLRTGEHDLSLYRITQPLSPGARLLVVLDDESRLDGSTLHAKGVAMDRESGAVELLNAISERVDRVAWGAASDAVDRVVSGGLGLTPTAGRSVGRPPGAHKRLRMTDWVVYPPADATPGNPNPLPRVEDLVPSSGAIVDAPSIPLSWYGVGGAARYRVQVARDAAFTAIAFDRTTETANVNPPPLAPGRYSWRVQAMDASGATSAFSQPAQFEIRSAPRRAAVAGGFRVQRVAYSPQAQSLPPPIGNILPVQLIMSHKDTRMLQLENQFENAPHGWDRDHAVYTSDPSDSNNCVPASVAMVNRFLGGDLSQDRIAYEVKSVKARQWVDPITSRPGMSGFEGRRTGTAIAEMLEPRMPDGPEWDFVYGRGDGMNAAHTVAALMFALSAGANLEVYTDRERLWRDIKTQINNGLPLLRNLGRHTVVIKGYEEVDGRRLLVLNNPAQIVEQREDIEDADLGQTIVYTLAASATGRRQEVGVTVDSDGDGIMDKIDVAAGVFETEHGYGYAFSPIEQSPGRDFDRDRKPTELDIDSDAGGCYDGTEDSNRDGKHQRSNESGNFEFLDDLCDGVWGKTWWTTLAVRDEPFYQFLFESARVSFLFDPEQAGRTGTLVDSGRSSINYVRSALQVLGDPSCQIATRTRASGIAQSGDRGFEAGGTVAPDGRTLVVNVQLSEFDEYVANEGCGESSGGVILGSIAQPECEIRWRQRGNWWVEYQCRQPEATPGDSLRIVAFNHSGVFRRRPTAQ